MPPSAKDQWLARLGEALRDGSFAKLTLGGPRRRTDGLENIFVRLVELKDGPRLSFVYRHATRDVTKNFTTEEALALIDDLVGAAFCHAHLFTSQSTLELKMRDGKGARVIEHKSAPAVPPALSHDQPKQRLIDPRASWLHALGVTAADGNVVKGMESKFRQINKFVEVLGHLLPESSSRQRQDAPTNAERGVRALELDQDQRLLTSAPTTTLTVVDMGCGKGYLTFAAYDWLQRSGWSKPTVRGLEARPDLVTLCNRVAKESRFDHLRFETGNITDAAIDRADVLIALHACDTATDDAIAKGVQAGASLIIVSPCCHKELRPQLQPPAALTGALRHGILLERHAEFVTDALRAALLEWAGYDTKVFEFVSTEHTAKNLMIAATKRKERLERRAPARHGSIASQRAGQEPGAPVSAEKHLAREARAVRDLAALYGIRQQRLATQLGFSLRKNESPA